MLNNQKLQKIQTLLTPNQSLESTKRFSSSIKQARKVFQVTNASKYSTSPIYNDTWNHEAWLNKDYKKLQKVKQYHACKGHVRTNKVEILDLLYLQIQLKNTD